MAHTTFGEHRLFDQGNEGPVPDLTEIRPNGAKRIASNRPGVRGNPSQARDGERDFPQKPWRFGSFLLACGAAKDCIARLRGCADTSPEGWCLVVSPGPMARPPAAESGRPEGSCALCIQPLNYANAGLGAEPVLILTLPAELFEERVAAWGSAPIRIPDAGLAAILVDYMLALEQRRPSLGEGEVHRLVEATKSLIAGCLAADIFDDLAGSRLAESRLAESRMRRAQSIIRQNLRSQHFGEADVRRALGISRSSLYRLFSRLGGVRRHLQRERLLQARRQLADPLNTKPIFRIAEELCFCDASSFSRAFKSEFGINPGGVRAMACTDRCIPFQALPAQDRRIS